MPAFTITVSEEENAFIEARREDMQRVLLGTSISKNEAVKNLILSDRKHEAQLFEVTEHILSQGISEALHSLGWEPDRIVAALEAFQEAHKEARRLHLPQVQVKDIP